MSRCGVACQRLAKGPALPGRLLFVGLNMRIPKVNSHLGRVSAIMAQGCANSWAQACRISGMCGNLAIPNHFLATVRGLSGPDSQLLIDSKGQNRNNGEKT